MSVVRWNRLSTVVILPMLLLACSSEEPGGPAGKPGADAEILSFTATPEQLAPGQEATLRWRTLGAVEVGISTDRGELIDLEGAPMDDGELVVTLERTTTFRLIATGASGNQVQRLATVEAIDPLEIVFEVRNEVVVYGEGTVLSWSIGRAAEISIEANGETFYTGDEQEGELPIQPDVTTVYRLSAKSEGIESSRSLTVAVEPAILSFASVEAGPFAIGSLVELSWKIGGATSAELMSEEGELEMIPEGQVSEGSMEVLAGPSGRYVLTARSGDRKASLELVIQVREGTDDVWFEASPQFVTSDLPEPEAVTLSWGAKEATHISLVADPGGEIDLSGKDPQGGSITVPVSQETHFLLTVGNEAGDVTEELWVRAVPKPSIHEFFAPLAAPASAPFQLLWLVEDAARIELERDGAAIEAEFVLPAGTAEQEIIVDTTFVLRAFNEAGFEVQEERVVSVALGDFPTVTLTADPPIFDEAPVSLSWVSESSTSFVLYEVDKAGALVVPPLVETTEPARVQEGSIEVRPRAPGTTYRAQVRNDDGLLGQRSITIQTIPAEVVSFRAEPKTELVAGELVDLHWETRRAKRVWLEPAVFGGNEDATYTDISRMGTPLRMIDACDVPRGTPEMHGCTSLTFPDDFTFPFDGELHSSAMIFISGVIGFDESFRGSVHSPLQLPALDLGHISLAPFWYPLTTLPEGSRVRPPGQVLYAIGTDTRGRYLVVQWSGMFVASDSSTSTTNLNFQVLLREDGSFEYRYGTMDSHARVEPVVGYQDRAGREGFSLPPSQLPAQERLQHQSFDFRLGELPSSGTLRITPIQGGTYSLLASDGHTTDRSSLELVVHERAMILDVSARPTEPVPGEEILVFVNAVGGDSLEILRAGDRSLVVEGSSQLTFVEEEEGIYEYLVRVVGAGEGNVAERPLTLTVSHLPRIEVFSAAPDEIEEGESATLSWETTLAQSIEIRADGVALDLGDEGVSSGSVQVEPTRTTTYTFIATNYGRSVTATSQVEVVRARLSDLRASATQVPPGTPVELSWATSGDGQITLQPPNFMAVDRPFVDLSEEAQGATELAFALNLNAAGWADVIFPGSFRFPFSGQERLLARVTNHGWLSFNSGVALNTRQDRLTVGAVTGVHLAPFWEDLHDHKIAKVYWKHFPDADPKKEHLLIQWGKMLFRTSPAPTPGTETDDLNFQVALYRDGSFEYRYGTMESQRNPDRAKGVQALIGFQDDTGLKGLEFSARRIFPNGLEGKAWRFDAAPIVGASTQVHPARTTTYSVCIGDDDFADCEEIRIVVPLAGDLLISELQLRPSGNQTANQWFEVRNLSPDPIDLRGMSITMNAGSHTISQGAPLVIGKGEHRSFSAGATPGFSPDYSYGTSLALGTNDLLSLEYGGPGMAVARASWNSTWPIVEGTSLGLDPSYHQPGKLSSIDPAHWCAATLGYGGNNFGSPGAVNEGCRYSTYMMDIYSSKPFIDISGDGTQTTFGAPLGLNFSMPFFGSQVEVAWVQERGLVGFGGNPINHNAVALPVSKGPKAGLVAPFWTGIDSTVEGGSVKHALRQVGGKDVLVIQWSDVGLVWVARGVATVQVQLWSDGDIVFVYETLRGNDVAHGLVTTVGIESVGATQVIQYLYDEAKLFEGQSIHLRMK